MTVTEVAVGDGPNPTPEADTAAEAGAGEAPTDGTSAGTDNGFETGGIVDSPVVPDPDIPGANQPLLGESSTWTEPLAG